MLAFEDAEWISAEALAAEICATPDLEGLTVVGGEPFAQASALSRVAELVKDAGLSVMVFSGYTLKHLRRAQNPDYERLLANIDLLVDGPYIERDRVTDRRWIGSSNQRVHFLTERYAHLRDSETGWDDESNTIEIRISGGVITVNGFPHDDITSLIAKLEGRTPE
jgi:anaerobic ribonucleoside-triphosphate reductase activating protein